MMKLIRVLLCAITLFMTMGVAHAQKIMGLVVEKNAKGVEEPLAGANVVWLGTTQGTSTEANGVFMIDPLEGATHLVISYVGYKSDTIKFDPQIRIKVILIPDELLDEVTVVGWKPSSGIDHTRSINTTVMTEKELFKAACCNLSESFETNPSVDVAFTDAITGTRQIQMLGLAGPNTMISIENMPGVRGLASSQGIQFIPGTWINSIQVTKGTGSVINGYESIAGQINVELKKPEESERLYVNGYVNNAARSELNVNYTAHVGEKWATTFLLHGSTRPFEMDSNDDSFLDFPTGTQINAINRWVYNNGKGLLAQFGMKILSDVKLGGQTDFDAEDKFTTNRYGFEIDTKRYKAWGKVGYQFDGRPYKSIGFQWSVMQHDHASFYGFNEHDANERSVYANLIYQSIVGSTNHKFKAGASFLYDRVDETFANQELEIIYRDTPVNSIRFDRREFVPGVFMEYNYDAGGKFSAIAGLRMDHHNLFGPLYTPRLHLRYNATETTTLRVSGGKGVRLANLLTESTGVLASARQFVFTGLQTNYAYGYKPDMAWNYGVNLSQDFTLDYRPGSITVDYFFTDFENQVVLDMDYSTREARFFGLTGRSFSQSFQFQVDYELMRRFDLRMAYRWLDVQTDYTNGRLTRPLIPQHRAFVNLAYETKNLWKFDYTVQVLGKQRIPNTAENLPQYQRESYSTSYMLMNVQVTKDIKDKWSVYLGVENINNFTLDNPIVAADDPFGAHNNFDSSLVWGPIFGRMVYAGFRFRMN